MYVDSSKQQQKDVWGFCGDNELDFCDCEIEAISCSSLSFPFAMKLRNLYGVLTNRFGHIFQNCVLELQKRI